MHNVSFYWMSMGEKVVFLSPVYECFVWHVFTRVFSLISVVTVWFLGPTYILSTCRFVSGSREEEFAEFWCQRIRISDSCSIGSPYLLFNMHNAFFYWTPIGRKVVCLWKPCAVYFYKKVFFMRAIWMLLGSILYDLSPTYILNTYHFGRKSCGRKFWKFRYKWTIYIWNATKRFCQ